MARQDSDNVVSVDMPMEEVLRTKMMAEKIGKGIDAARVWRDECKSLGVAITTPYRDLKKEPLIVSDWRAIYTAQQGFLAQVKIIVAHARVRAKVDQQRKEAEEHAVPGGDREQPAGD